MKSLKFIPLSLLVLISINLYSDETTESNKKQPSYFQGSSFMTQVPDPISGSLVITENIDLLENFDYSPNKDSFICKVPGVYLLYSGAQPAALARGISGYLDVCFEINGKPIGASNSRQYVSENNRVNQISNTFLVKLKANDIVSNRMNASGPNIGIIFIQSSLSSEPSVSRFLFSAYKID
jgi:hypothetical protein